MIAQRQDDSMPINFEEAPGTLDNFQFDSGMV